MASNCLIKPDQLYNEFSKSTIDNLWLEAQTAQQNAYARYSNFKVGAAILDNQNQIHSGCNFENAAYPLSICAETGAIGKMVASGSYQIKTILIVAHSEDDLIATPCGGCRQQISEFATPKTAIIMATNQKINGYLLLEQLLAFNFSSSNLVNESK